MSKCSLKDINSYCGRKRKRKGRNSCVFFPYVCEETLQMDYLLGCWALLVSPSSSPTAQGLARLTNALALCWRLKFNRLLLINMSKLGQLLSPFPSYPHMNHYVTVFILFPSWTYLTFLADVSLLPPLVCCLRNRVGVSSHISHLVSSP